MPQAPPSQKEPWFHQNPKKTLALVIGLAVLLIVFAAEKILQFYNHRRGVFLESEPRYIRLKEYPPGTRIVLPFPRGHLAFTDNAFTKKYTMDVDNDGFIKPSRKHAQPDLSLVFLGGSTTECMFVDEENRFPYVAGAILEQETGRKINAYNAGMSGINSLHCLDILLHKAIPLHPRAMVFMENINDLSTLLYEGTYWNQNTTRLPVETLKKTKLVGKLLMEICIPNLNYAYRNLRSMLESAQGDEFDGARGKKLQVDKAGLTREFAMNLKSLVDLCQVRGIVPVLMTQANRITDHPDPVVAAYVNRSGQDAGLTYREFKEIYDAFNDTIRRIGRQNQVLVIDLAQEVPPEKTYLYDMVHFNDRGSRYAGSIIAAKLKSVMAP